MSEPVLAPRSPDNYDDYSGTAEHPLTTYINSRPPLDPLSRKAAPTNAAPPLRASRRPDRAPLHQSKYAPPPKPKMPRPQSSSTATAAHRKAAIQSVYKQERDENAVAAAAAPAPKVMHHPKPVRTQPAAVPSASTPSVRPASHGGVQGVQGGPGLHKSRSERSVGGGPGRVWAGWRCGFDFSFFRPTAALLAHHTVFTTLVYLQDKT